MIYIVIYVCNKYKIIAQVRFDECVHICMKGRMREKLV